MNANWPDIPFEQWRGTCSALHIYSQIVGKYRLARTPWLNHSWHATLYVKTRGLTTSLVPGGRALRSPSISGNMPSSEKQRTGARLTFR